MLLTKTVIIKWQRKTCTYFKNIGYNFTKIGDEFEVKVEELTEGSHTSIECLCDYCLETIIPKEYRRYLEQNANSIIHKDCCENCWNKKLQESLQGQYGVSNVSNLQKVVDKRTETFIRVFGVDNPRKDSNIVEKGRKTNLEKYGYIHPMQDKEIRNKRGEKRAKTLYENGGCICSSQQTYIHNLLGGELNYPQKYYNLDIAFPEDMIYVECDFSGHDLNVQIGNISEEEYKIKDRKRYFYLKNNGWKLIKIISTKDKLPNDEIIKYLIKLGKYHLKHGRTYFEINIDKLTFNYNKTDYKMNYGKLKKISKKDNKLNKSQPNQAS
jgi:hypothetical protein